MCSLSLYSGLKLQQAGMVRNRGQPALDDSPGQLRFSLVQHDRRGSLVYVPNPVHSHPGFLVAGVHGQDLLIDHSGVPARGFHEVGGGHIRRGLCQQLLDFT